MTAPNQAHSAQGQVGKTGESSPNLMRWAIWVAIGALIAAAVVCVVWVLLGSGNGIIGRAFLTILLLAAFAGIAILETHLAANRPAWFSLTSMIVWVVTMLLGAFLIWMPIRNYFFGEGFGRFVSFLTIVLVLQLAVLHVRLYTKALERNPSGFTRVIGIVTIALVAILAILLVVPLTFREFIDFAEIYWRIVVALTILAAVGTAIVPLVNALFAPKRERVAEEPYGYAPVAYGQVPGYAPALAVPQGNQGFASNGSVAQPWPTYADGVTPLPWLPDGTPDWNAYYTGQPSAPQQQAPAAVQTEAAASAHEAASVQPEQAQRPPVAPEGAPGHEGYPPRPPLPPQ